MDKEKEGEECRTGQFEEHGTREYELLTSAAGASRGQQLPLWSHAEATLRPLAPPSQWLSAVGAPMATPFLWDTGFS